MCKIENKQMIMEYMLNRIGLSYKNIAFRSSNDSKNREYLTPYRLVYPFIFFTCLESTEIAEDKIGLFNIFDKFHLVPGHYCVSELDLRSACDLYAYAMEFEDNDDLKILIDKSISTFQSRNIMHGLHRTKDINPHTESEFVPLFYIPAHIIAGGSSFGQLQALYGVDYDKHYITFETTPEINKKRFEIYCSAIENPDNFKFGLTSKILGEDNAVAISNFKKDLHKQIDLIKLDC